MPDDDAVYERVIDIDLGTIHQTVSFPHLPDNTRTAEEWGDIKIDQVVIGSCTNGRISDMRLAAEILKGKHVAKGVRCIVIPGTQKIYMQCVKEGLAEIFVEAGCVFSTPTCGPCLGGHMGILAAGERAVSTTNRNFVGRMGHVDSEVYLASPIVAAASAIAGKLAGTEKSNAEKENAVAHRKETPMIRHIKILDFRNDMSDSDKRIAAYKIKNGIESLNDKIPGLIRIEAEDLLLPSSNAGMIIIGEFETEAAIEAYENSPLRLNFSNIWDSSVASVKTANYGE